MQNYFDGSNNQCAKIQGIAFQDEEIIFSPICMKTNENENNSPTK